MRGRIRLEVTAFLWKRQRRGRGRSFCGERRCSEGEKKEEAWNAMHGRNVLRQQQRTGVQANSQRHATRQRRLLTERGKFAQPAAVNSTLSRYSPYAYAVLRIITGLLFACHGGQKILGFPPVAKAMQLDTMGMVGGYIELICGFLIAFGLLTRPAAFLASGMMAVAYFMVHAKGGLFPIINRGEPAVIYCFTFLYMFFRGSGPLALDNLIFREAAAADAVGGPTRVGRTL